MIFLNFDSKARLDQKEETLSKYRKLLEQLQEDFKQSSDRYEKEVKMTAWWIISMLHFVLCFCSTNESWMQLYATTLQVKQLQEQLHSKHEANLAEVKKIINENLSKPDKTTASGNQVFVLLLLFRGSCVTFVVVACR